MLRLLLLFLAATLHAEPVAVYLTVQKDPVHNMTVCWIEGATEEEQELKFHEASSDQWYQVKAVPTSFPGKLPYSLFVVELENLKPDKKYEFSLSRELFSFKTLPEELSKPVKFVVGGDIYHDKIETVAQMNEVARAQNPDFALLGGDIAYSGSRFIFFQEEGKRWVQFLQCWYQTMRQSDGTLIPLIATIGNHDVNGRYDQAPEYAPFYHFLFPTHSTMGYRVLDFGDYLSLWVLDSGHVRPVQGDQTVWLEKTLLQRGAVPLKIALYHVPAYPSARSYDNRRSAVVRKFWIPLFEKYGVRVAFENHDHAYKRTHLIKNGKVAEEGVLYMGDGAWGVEDPRSPKSPKERWYLAASAKKQHIVLATVEKDAIVVQAFDPDGKIFDQFKLHTPSEN